ncbi:hypothetical protein N566_18770 [Streptomycetaceae bacterium MP113-05]|nr:hypothetical protein N566_18770 [Streptomycetaceae bacterium MP113-05]
MAKQKKQDRSRAQKQGAEPAQDRAQKDATNAREHMGSPADVARKGKKPSFGHN